MASYTELQTAPYRHHSLWLPYRSYLPHTSLIKSQSFISTYKPTHLHPSSFFATFTLLLYSTLSLLPPYSKSAVYSLNRCNSLLVSLPAYQTDRIQIVLNDAARLIFGGSRRDHVTPILCDRLHWLRASQRIEFKVVLLMYKGMNNLAPDYITSYCISSSTNQRRFKLRSADKGNLIEPKTVAEFGKRSFAFAGPQLWNKLPIKIRQSSSVDIFKKRLKTFLFDKSYND